MMSPEATITPSLIEEIVGNHDWVCDYNELDGCPKDPARWIVTLSKCACGASGHRTICSTCKEGVLTSEAGLLCGACESSVWMPARLAFSRIDPLS